RASIGRRTARHLPGPRGPRQLQDSVVDALFKGAAPSGPSTEVLETAFVAIEPGGLDLLVEIRRERPARRFEVGVDLELGPGFDRAEQQAGHESLVPLVVEIDLAGSVGLVQDEVEVAVHPLDVVPDTPVRADPL